MTYEIFTSCLKSYALTLVEAKQKAREMLKNEYFPSISEGAEIYDEEGNIFEISCDFITEEEILELAQRNLNLDFGFYNFPTASVATWIKVLYLVSEKLSSVDYYLFDIDYQEEDEAGIIHETGRIRGSVMVDKETFTFECDDVSVTDGEWDEFYDLIVVKRVR